MPDLIGKTLGSYRIVEQIGLGGMATVYKAYQPSMDRYVALKVLSTHFAQDATFLKRFEQEAKIIARLEHLHILPVYDHGEDDGYLYLVMRYTEAGTLKDRLKQGPLSVGEARRVVMQVGSALEYAHQLGVIHRDVKPSNVLVDPQGDCYLTDFGIAKMVESTLGLTGSAVVGTPHYMAPEQSKSLTVDHRADIYAMGVVIYEMVTGQLPYDAETPFAVVFKHITEPLPLPRKIKPDLSESVERVILRALAKDPTDRYASMRDLVAAFDEAARAAPVETPADVSSPVAPPPSVIRESAPPAPPKAREAAPPWKRWLADQPPWLLPAAGLALAVLVIAGIILSRIPGRIEIAGGQVQLVTPTVGSEATALVTSVVALPKAQATATAEPLMPTSTPEVTRTPTSTPTPTPTPTPNIMPEQARAFAEPILKAIADRPPSFQDDFSDPKSGWYIVAGDPSQAGYENGEYFIVAPPNPSWPEKEDCCGASAASDLTPRVSDFVLGIDIRVVSGAPAGWQVSFRAIGPSSYGVRGLDVNMKLQKGINVGPNTWQHTELASLARAPFKRYETNHLQIIAKGPQMAVYVNGQPLFWASDDALRAGAIGFAVDTKTNIPAQARFDNLKIWDISKLSLL